LVSAKSGVAVGTEKAWARARERKIPVIFFVNKMDDENANFFRTLEQLAAAFGKNVIAFQIPIVENSKFTGYVDIVTMKAKKFDKDKLVDTDIPSELNNQAQEIRNALIEAVAETSEELMEKFFDGQEFTDEEISKGIRQGIKDGSLVPVFCGSAALNFGVKTLMDSIIEFMPSPIDSGVIKAKNQAKTKFANLKPARMHPFRFSLQNNCRSFRRKDFDDKSILRTLKSESTVYNTTTGKTEKISQLFVLRGKKNIPVDKLVTGDIGAVTKLQSVNTNDTLCTQENPVVLDKIEFPEPVISMAVQPTAKVMRKK